MNLNSSISKRKFLKIATFGLIGIPLLTYSKSNIHINNNPLLYSNKMDDLTDLIKHSKEALYYSKKENNKVECNLCPNNCLLSENKRGKCKNRINYKGTLYTIAYGNPCVVNIDPIEKKPLFHFLPETNIYSISTAGCNFACLNCQNWSISQVGPDKTDNYSLSPVEVINAVTKANLNTIAFTYSEPIAYFEYMIDIAKLANKKGIKTVFISNGYINEEPLNELCKYISAASINLKSFKESIYKDLNNGSLQPVLNTLKTLKDNNIWTEIINLIIPTWTDDMDMIQEMCKWLVDNGFSDFPLHFSRFSPMYKLTNLIPTPIVTLEKAMKIAKLSGINYVYIGNLPGHDTENTYCPKCKKLIISRKGFTVLENHIINNKCEYCGNNIAGIWE